MLSRYSLNCFSEGFSRWRNRYLRGREQFYYPSGTRLLHFTPPNFNSLTWVLHLGLETAQIIGRFQRRYPPEFDEKAGVEERKAVVMQMPPTPEQRRFYSALLFELGASFNASAKLSVLENLSRELLR